MTSRLCAYDSGATLTLGLAAATADSHTLTGTSTLAQAVAAGDIIRINGIDYRVTTGAAAGAAVTGVVVYAQATAAAAVTASVSIAANSRKITRQGLEIQTKRWAPTLDTLSINAHSIDIYKEFPVGFFNAYTGYHYGGPNINAAEDAGSLFVPFCIYPGYRLARAEVKASASDKVYLVTYRETSKLRENLVKCLVLSIYGNIYMVAGKPSQYSNNLNNRDNSQPIY